MPTTNQNYWRSKIERNVLRDRRAKRALNAAGWHYWTVWECKLAGDVKRMLRRAEWLARRGEAE